MDGAGLRAAREAAGLSLRRMALIIGVSAGHLGQIEIGRRTVTHADISRYERALNVQLTPVEKTAVAVTVDDMKRRDFIGLVASASMGATTPAPVGALLDGLRQVEPPARVGLAEVQAVEQAASLFMRMDLAHGGGIAIEMGRSSLRWAESLLQQRMSQQTRERLCTAVALLADRLGWAAYDTGDSAGARRLLLWGLDHAAHGADRDLRAHIMLDLSTVLTDEGNPRDGVEILRLALGDDRLSGAERANLHAVCARHCGTAGDIAAGMRHVGLSEDAQLDLSPVDKPEWAQRVTLSPGHHQSALGLALFELGQEQSARDRLTGALDHLETGRTRTGLRCRARLAVLDLRGGDTSYADKHAQQALADAQGVKSRRIAADLAMVAREAGQHGHPELADQISMLMPG